jgi:hypothetical protein
MRIESMQFNLYLSFALCTLLLAGCQSTSEPDAAEITSLRVHLETNPDPRGTTPSIAIYRQNPVMISTHSQPFLDERNVMGATLIETLGGFSIQLNLDQRGTWLLESYTVSNKGKRMAIMCQFGETPDETRWLAAPVIRRIISDGVLVFTPDATREEAERIVAGLNLVAKENAKKYTF